MNDRRAVLACLLLLCAGCAGPGALTFGSPVARSYGSPPEVASAADWDRWFEAQKGKALPVRWYAKGAWGGDTRVVGAVEGRASDGKVAVRDPEGTVFHTFLFRPEPAGIRLWAAVLARGGRPRDFYCWDHRGPVCGIIPACPDGKGGLVTCADRPALVGVSTRPGEGGVVRVETSTERDARAKAGGSGAVTPIGERPVRFAIATAEKDLVLLVETIDAEGFLRAWGVRPWPEVRRELEEKGDDRALASLRAALIPFRGDSDTAAVELEILAVERTLRDARPAREAVALDALWATGDLPKLLAAQAEATARAARKADPLPGTAERTARLAARLDAEAAAARAGRRVATAATYAALAARLRKEEPPAVALATAEAGDALTGRRELAALVRTLLVVPRGEDDAGRRIAAAASGAEAGWQLWSFLRLRPDPPEVRGPAEVRIAVGEHVWGVFRAEVETVTHTKERTSTSSRANPSYQAWLERLADLDARIRRAGGSVDGTWAARNKQFVTVHSYAQGSGVKSSTRETDQSIRDSQAAAVNRAILRNQLRDLERERADHLGREPSMELRADQVAKVSYPVEEQVWSGRLTREVKLRGAVVKTVDQKAVPKHEYYRTGNHPAAGIKAFDGFITEDQLRASFVKRLDDELVALVGTAMSEETVRRREAARLGDGPEHLLEARLLKALMAPSPEDLNAALGLGKGDRVEAAP